MALPWPRQRSVPTIPSLSPGLAGCPSRAWRWASVSSCPGRRSPTCCRGLHRARPRAPGAAAREEGRPALPPWAKGCSCSGPGRSSAAPCMISGTEPFSALEFAKSLAKLSFYAVAAGPGPGPARHAARGAVAPGPHRFRRCRRGGHRLLRGDGAGPPPYHLLWGHSTEASYFSDHTWFGGPHEARNVVLRAQGLASEPSRPDISVHGPAYLLLGPGAGIRLGLRLALIVVSLLLTFSSPPTRCCFVAALVVATRWRGRARRRRPRPGRGGGAAIAPCPSRPPSTRRSSGHAGPLGHRGQLSLLRVST